MSANKIKATTTRLPLDLRVQVEEYAKKNDLTISQVIIKSVRFFLDYN